MKIDGLNRKELNEAMIQNKYWKEAPIKYVLTRTVKPYADFYLFMDIYDIYDIYFHEKKNHTRGIREFQQP